MHNLVWTEGHPVSASNTAATVPNTETNQMFDWLFRRFRESHADHPSDAPAGSNTGGTGDPDEALSKVVWIEPEDNPFNMRVLDCRPFTTTMMSVTSDRAVAERYAKSRQSTGEEYAGKLPSNAVRVETALVYPNNGSIPGDGALFLSQAMEDKWDIFLHNGYLYFTRSWTGVLSFRASVRFDETEVRITGVDADSDVVDGDSEMAMKVVDFLVKSHLYCYECPHPVPDTMRDDDHQKIALCSLSSFGRRAYFASFEDTTKVRVPHESGD